MRLVLRILRVVFSSVYLAVVTVVVAPLLFVAAILAGLLFLPLPAAIPVPVSRPATPPTTIYDRNGAVIGVFAQTDHNVGVTEAQIPDVVREAVVSDEDRKYFTEGGIDLRGTVRALVADLRNKAVVQGGSTITQQYVKLAYLNSERTIVRKVREAILASQLSRQASKSEILYRYLTLVYFGDDNYGVGAAAEDYFHEPVSSLDASQAATLAGLIPAPTERDPNTDLALAEQYRVLVLGKMLQQGYLTESGYETALAEHLALAPDPGQPAAPAGATLVYHVESVVSPYPAFVDYLERWLRANGYSQQELEYGGLRIQTTLDPRLQNDATAAVATALDGTPPGVQMAMASVQPETGFVEALVGGRDFVTPLGQPNLAVSACDPVFPGSDPTATCWDGNDIDNEGSPGRQPGSSWKPFVLATAFMQGILPSATYPAPSVYRIPGCVVYRDQPADACEIRNDDGEGFPSGQLSLSEAMAASVNTVYAQLATQVGCADVARTAKALGIDSAYYSLRKFPFCQSFALGEVDVAPLDMASAYGVFDDHGVRAAPTPVLEIVDTAGRVLLDNISKPPKTTRAIPANIADNVTKVLQGVLEPGGTAAAHPLPGRPAAGKTGTTNDETNAWFTGYTPTLSTSVWEGFGADQATTLDGVKGERNFVGGTWPAQTWSTYMQAALAGVPATQFDAPAPIVTPMVAAALAAAAQARAPATVAPGYRSAPSSAPAGGPYVLAPEAPPVAVPPDETPGSVPGSGSAPTTTSPPTTGGPGGDGQGPDPGVPGAQTTTTAGPLGF